MRIQKQILKKLNDPSIIADIAKANGRHYVTAERWVNDNHENLTNAASLQVICERLALTQDQILEKEVA